MNLLLTPNGKLTNVSKFNAQLFAGSKKKSPLVIRGSFKKYDYLAAKI